MLIQVISLAKLFIDKFIILHLHNVEGQVIIEYNYSYVSFCLIKSNW